MQTQRDGAPAAAAAPRPPTVLDAPAPAPAPSAQRMLAWASRPSAELMAVLVAAGLALGWLLPAYVHQGIAHLQYWLLIPTLVAAVRFGLRGAIVTSVLSTLTAGPLSSVLPGQTDTWHINVFAELMFFLSVSVVVAVLVRYAKAADATVLAMLSTQRQQASKVAEVHGELTRELERRVYEDDLTGLANRLTFTGKLQDMVAQQRSVAVLFIDLDDFKTVNDTLGHAVGDELLMAVAARLLTGSRADDIVARFGGDEFAVLLADVSGKDAGRVAERFLAQLKAPFTLAGRTVTARASGGIAVHEGAAVTSAEQRALDLLRQADLAMYASKDSRSRGITLFHANMQSQMVTRLALESDMHRALAEHEFYLEYQPIVDLRTGAAPTVEALLRWAHPARGTVPPAEFIPVAEQTGMIVPLSLWVLREACSQLRQWDTKPETSGLSVAINISGRLVLEPGIGAALARELFHAGIAPHRIILEITESLLMEDRSEAVATLCQLRALGMRLSVDDFGTGYSSLNRLNTLPIDEVKIDQSFVGQLASDGPATTIVAATIAMAHGLGLRVTAEGVETERQLAKLTEMGCDEGQGYFFGRPVSAKGVSDFIASQPLTETSGDNRAVVRSLPTPRHTNDAATTPGPKTASNSL
jgi:diguanylate cyclase (GGDEF)-like protein